MSRIIAAFVRFASAAALLGGCLAAQADTVVFQDSTGKVINASLNVGGTNYSVDWYLPSGTASALVTVQHGFSRGCGNLRDTSKRMMANGLMVFCMNANMSGGAPALAETLGDALVNGGIVTPDGRGIPAKIIVGGHSAGGHFATRLGWKLNQIAPSRLLGSILFDPVAAGGFTDNLVAISNAGQRPVYAITSNSSLCNQFNNAYGALRQIRNAALANGRDGFVGLQLTSWSTHVDSEGNNTDIIGYGACLQSPPKSTNIGYLRDLSSQWAFDLANGVKMPTAYPGGSYVNSLLTGKWATLIQ
ncbi:alpha/beta hydrolase [Aquabacterium sp.]|uniref:alpha/beta hydrolase n=1 Tax=Aquabacterium sp. TaxID=1872578 RepID=UPI0035B0729F